MFFFLLALSNHYVKALRHVLFWLKENKVNPNKKVLQLVHQELYEKLREEFSLPSKVAEECYRNAISMYKGWFNNPKKRRFPRVYKPTVWLTPKLSYSIDFEKMIVRIASVGELPILGYPRNLFFYKDWDLREARLVTKDKVFLKVTFEKEQQVQPKGSVAVDVNMGEIVVGKDDKNYVRIPTSLHEVHDFKSLAENLQRRYKRWKENRRIMRRIRSFHQKSMHIMEDYVKRLVSGLLKLLKVLT